MLVLPTPRPSSSTAGTAGLISVYKLSKYTSGSQRFRETYLWLAAKVFASKEKKRSSLYIMAGTNKQYYAFNNMEEFSTAVALYEECSFILITKFQMFCFVCLKPFFAIMKEIPCPTTYLIC